MALTATFSAKILKTICAGKVINVGLYQLFHRNSIEKEVIKYESNWHCEKSRGMCYNRANRKSRIYTGVLADFVHFSALKVRAD